MKGDLSDGGDTSSCGNDWEVVSLTASTYAAAPGPKGSESFYDYKNEVVTNDEEKSSPGMFMSSHFVYPPQQHENFPVEPDNNEIHNGLGGEGLDQPCGLETVEGDRPGKTVEEDWNIKGHSNGHDIHGIPFSGSKRFMKLLTWTSFLRWMQNYPWISLKMSWNSQQKGAKQLLITFGK